jgi:hypothetical protein
MGRNSHEVGAALADAELLKVASDRLDALRKEIEAHPDHKEPKPPNYSRGEPPGGWITRPGHGNI